MEIPQTRAAGMRAAYWIRVRRLTMALLAIWFVGTFGIVFFARELSGITVFGWPLSFYMAAQGTILMYVAIVAFYAWRMSRLDRMLGKEAGNGE